MLQLNVCANVHSTFELIVRVYNIMVTLFLLLFQLHFRRRLTGLSEVQPQTLYLCNSRLHLLQKVAQWLCLWFKLALLLSGPGSGLAMRKEECMPAQLSRTINQFYSIAS